MPRMRGWLILAVLLAGCGDGGGASRNISIDDFTYRYTSFPVHVGDPMGLTVTIKNPHQDLADATLDFSAGSWLGHHVVQSMTPECRRDHIGDDQLLRCGPVAKGNTLTITLDAIAKDSGNMDYTVTLMDIEGSQGSDLHYPTDPAGNNEFKFSETVNP